MKIFKHVRASRFGPGLLLGFLSAGAIADLPVAEYACQVVVDGGRVGIVLVQADARDVALRAAVGAPAFTTDNTRGHATKVVECIRRPDERFRDFQVQQFFESMPK